MAKELGLRRRGNQWIYRRRVPDDLRASFGKREIKESLRTSDLAEAKVRRHEVAAKWERAFNRERRKLALPTSDAIRSAVSKFVAERTRADAEDFHALDANPAPPLATTEDAKDEIHFNIHTYRNPHHELTSLAIGSLIKDIYSDRLPPRKKGSSALEQIEADAMVPDVLSHLSVADRAAAVEFFRQALLERELRNLDLLEGRQPRTHNKNFLPADRAPVSLRQATTEFLTEYFTRKLTLKRRQSLQAEADMLLFVIGPEILVSEIGRQSCRKFRDTINQLPTNITKYFPAYREMRLEDILSEAKRKALPRMKRATQAKYTTMLRSIMDFAEKEQYIKANPARDLMPLGDKVSPRKAREPFETDDLAKIFNSGHFATRDNARSDRFWVPLIGLFSGMRLNEICQLNVGDIKQSPAGIWYIDINADDNTKSVKNDRSVRCVPVHSELKKCGFTNFVEGERKRGSSEKLFQGIKRTEVRNYGASLSKWFNRTFLPNAQVKSEKKTFHSFRHVFKDALTNARIHPDFIDALGGWNTIRSGSSGIYGKGPDIGELATEIEKVSYTGLDLSHLHDEEGSLDPS